MGCKTTNTERGAMIACSRPTSPKQCAYCKSQSNVLCDFETSPGITCDTPMCIAHTKRVAYQTDHCRIHRKES